MTDQWIEDFLFPEKSMEASGRQPIDFEYIYQELAKPNVTLSLLHYEYEAQIIPAFESRAFPSDSTTSLLQDVNESS